MEEKKQFQENSLILNIDVGEVRDSDVLLNIFNVFTVLFKLKQREDRTMYTLILLLITPGVAVRMTIIKIVNLVENGYYLVKAVLES